MLQNVSLFIQCVHRYIRAYLNIFKPRFDDVGILIRFYMCSMSLPDDIELHADKFVEEVVKFVKPSVTHIEIRRFAVKMFDELLKYDIDVVGTSTNMKCPDLRRRQSETVPLLSMTRFNDDKLDFAQRKHVLESIQCLYQLINDGSQWMVSPAIYSRFRDIFGRIDLECFASPYNKNALNIPYCSMYGLDKYVGSSGSFFDLKLKGHVFIANPPFVEIFMKRFAERTLAVMKRRQKLTFLVFYPKWRDAEGYTLLKDSGHVVLDMSLNAGIYIDPISRKPVPNRFETLFILLSNDKSIKEKSILCEQLLMKYSTERNNR